MLQSLQAPCVESSTGQDSMTQMEDGVSVVPKPTVDSSQPHSIVVEKQVQFLSMLVMW